MPSLLIAPCASPLAPPSLAPPQQENYAEDGNADDERQEKLFQETKDNLQQWEGKTKVDARGMGAGGRIWATVWQRRARTHQLAPLFTPPTPSSCAC